MASTHEFLSRLQEKLLAEDLAPGTIERCEVDAAQFATWYLETTGQEFNPNLVVTVDLAEWRSHLQRKGLKPSSLTRKFASLRTVFRLLAPERLEQIRFPKMPKQRIDAPSGFTRTERNSIIRACERMHVRDAAIVKTLLYTGGRASSVADLRLSDVQLGPRGGHVAYHGKGDRFYEVPANCELRQALSAYLEWRPQTDHDRFFVGLREPHPPISRKVIHAVWQELRRYVPDALAAKIKGPHQARHDLARRLLSGDEGTKPPTPLADVAAILGHANADPRITAGIYARPSKEALARALDQIVGDDGE
jgi:integrase/recombinase XerD